MLVTGVGGVLHLGQKHVSACRDKSKYHPVAIASLSASLVSGEVSQAFVVT